MDSGDPVYRQLKNRFQTVLRGYSPSYELNKELDEVGDYISAEDVDERAYEFRSSWQIIREKLLD